LWCLLIGAADAVAGLIEEALKGTGSITAVSIAIDMLPGIMFLLISWTTNEKIGYGDGMMILIIGLIMHSQLCITAVAIGLVISSMFSVIMIFTKRMNLRTRIPFIPFLTIGVGISLWAM
jgi:prepilin signal peptidase PulO-like enzyme (type II secretory pathway)